MSESNAGGAPANAYGSGSDVVLACRGLALGESHAEIVGHSHDLSSRLHLRTEEGVDARKLGERKHRNFYRNMGDGQLFGETERADALTEHHAQRRFHERYARRFAYERHRP